MNILEKLKFYCETQNPVGALMRKVVDSAYLDKVLDRQKAVLFSQGTHGGALTLYIRVI